MEDEGTMSLGDFFAQVTVQMVATFVRRTIFAPTVRLSVLMTTEGELVRQEKIPKSGFGGWTGCIKRIYVQEGPLAFFRGLLTDAVFALPSTVAEEVCSSVVSSVVQNALGERVHSMSQLAILTASLGATAAVSQVTAVLNDPIQTVMTKLYADVTNEEGKFQYTGATAVFKDTYSRGGIGGFFRAISINAISSLAYRGSYYYIIHLFMSAMTQEQQMKHGMLVSRLVSLLSGFVAQPVEVVRRRLMLAAAGEKQYNGVVDCVQSIIRDEGIFALWSGLQVRLVITAVGFAFAIIGELTN